MRVDELMVEIKRLVSYDPETGQWTKLYSKQQDKIGPYVPPIHKADGYRKLCIGAKKYYAHRLAWFYVYGEWPKGDVDHVNGDKLDNRISNLRDVPKAVNNQNRSAPIKGSKSVSLGVAKLKSGRFYTRISVSGVRHELGCFDTHDEASNAYFSAKKRLHHGYATGIGATTPPPTETEGDTK